MSDRTAKKTNLIAMALETDAGMSATFDQHDAIARASSLLEPYNPHPNATERLDLMARRWKMLYTNTNLEKKTTLNRLSFGRLPNVEAIVTNLYQEIQLEDKSYVNLIEFKTTSYLEGIASVCAHFEVVSPARLEINFYRVAVSPRSSNTDVAVWQEALGLGDSQTLTLEADLNFQGWIDTTYLDEDLRIVRGNAGHLYILVPARN